jgi:hypothetical protein
MSKWLRLVCETAVQRRVDGVENAVEVGGDLPIPKAQDAISFGFQPILARLIPDGDLIPAVVSAIELDNQHRRETGEIGDVWANRDLPAEVRAVDRHIVQSAPELALGTGCVRAQPLRGRSAKAGQAGAATILPWTGRVGCGAAGVG